ncbi:28S ribosomal protein S5, mitochondrial [Microsporum canis]|uniref:Small ribosomal subunit protein uS5m n=1 Tax=Arthroderma otae (strain ATCC MYA-4605 / CBS 113480) TaxID=554155 RepID=C5FJL4_ARTOC|nr:mitochondrial 37S ribosomal protein MRPS5 [Microsporum canis CBS 113480]EEQ30875.1 37S ribosomal protein S5 [Microsporum canis CBS 113480]
MSVTRPARCLFCTFSKPNLVLYPRRQFHSTPIPCAPRKPKHQNVKASDVEGWLKQNVAKSKAYSEEEKAHMKKEYSPEQIKAIEAGEKAIPDEDVEKQFTLRDDPWALKYVDDFSTIEPVVDHHIRAPITNSDPNSRLKTDDELAEDLAKFVKDMPEEPSVVDLIKFFDNTRLTAGKAEAELNPHSSLVPDLFESGENFTNIGRHVTPPPFQLEKPAPEVSDSVKRLMALTGYDASHIDRIQTKVLVCHSVVNQTRLGKIQKTYVLAIAGNKNGLLGIGEGKSEEMDAARAQAEYRAIRNMQPVPRYERRTIYGDVKAKVAGTELVLMNRPPGFGLRCSQRIWEMCQLAGIKDLAARVSRSRNPMNSAKAAYKALMSQKNPDDVARALGKKLVDVRKVYYAGRV